MINDPMWRRDLIAALHLENLFVEQQLGSAGTAPMASDLAPTWAETNRAIANIRYWRSFLPVPCVQKMIDDGWQWST